MHNGKAAALFSHSCLCALLYCTKETSVRALLFFALLCAVWYKKFNCQTASLDLLPLPLPSSSSSVDTTTTQPLCASSAQQQQQQLTNNKSKAKTFVCVHPSDYIGDVFLLLGDYHTSITLERLTVRPPPFTVRTTIEA